MGTRVHRTPTQLLDNSQGCMACISSDEQRSLRRLLVAFSRSAKQLPSSLSLEGIELQEKHPIIGGGNADIFRAMYKGRLVALKRLRIYERSPREEKQEDVSFVNKISCNGDSKNYQGISQGGPAFVVPEPYKHTCVPWGRLNNI